MTDQIPADKVRPILDEWERIKEHADWEDMDNLVQSVRALLPVPPTLADMTMEERYECRWMQCDVRNAKITHGVIANNHGGNTHVLDAEGEVWYLPPADITPRPDLPRLEWPGPDQDGEEVTKVDYVSVAGGRTAYGPWTVARLRKKADTTPALPDGWRLADHKDYGRGIVTRATPGYEGDAHFVYPSDARSLGYTWHCCDPDDLTYIDQGDADATD